MLFVADAASVTFHFQGFPDQLEVGVDNFELSDAPRDPGQIPEPASLLLLGTGFAALARRRLRKR